MNESSNAPDTLVRALRADDIDRLVRIDERIGGRRRHAFFERKIAHALRESDIGISLAAVRDGTVVGAVLAEVHYGEFGIPEPVAVIDTVLVDPGYQGHGVARALLDELRGNLAALGIERLRTEVDWADRDLVGFFAASGFAPVARLVLEANVGA